MRRVMLIVMVAVVAAFTSCQKEAQTICYQPTKCEIQPELDPNGRMFDRFTGYAHIRTPDGWVRRYSEELNMGITIAEIVDGKEQKSNEELFPEVCYDTDEEFVGQLRRMCIK